MKLVTAATFFAIAICTWAEKQMITPSIGSQFGEVVRIEAEFIDKQNTYHDQNIVKEPFLLSVLSVNGKALNTPITIEYTYDTDNSGLKKGRRYQFEAYETIYTFGFPRDWDEYAQINYTIHHILIVRSLKTNEGEQGVAGYPPQGVGSPER